MKSMIIKENIEIKIDSNKKIMWLKAGSPNELHFSYKTICNFYESKKIVAQKIKEENIQHLLLISPNKTVWNMGGDLEFFVNCAINKERKLLKDYAYKCVEIVYDFNNSFNSDVIITSIIQGNAFGGGFEYALSSHYIISEAHAKYSFPEILFGTFPGMGAYSFLTRKVGYHQANNIINSKKRWTSEELKELNIIDYVCDFGQGINMALELVAQNTLKTNNHFSKTCNMVTLGELTDIVDNWLESVMMLDNKNLDFMSKIVMAQKVKMI